MTAILPLELFENQTSVSAEKLAAKVQSIFEEEFQLPGDAPARVICVDQDAEPPHHLRSELRISLANAGHAAAESLVGNRHGAISLIVSVGERSICLKRLPEGILVTDNRDY